MQVKLVNTIWVVEKVEVLENDAVTQTFQPDPELESELRISFKHHAVLSLYNENDAKGCGQWSAADNTIRFVISYGQVVPGLCSKTISLGLFSAYEKISFENDDTLFIEGLGGAINHFDYLSEWPEIRDQVAQGEVKLKTYYTRVDSGDEPAQECCATFGWL